MKEFPKWNQYQRHLKTHQEEDKPYRCPKCTQTFNVEDNLHLHMAIHDPENPVCPECGKKFSRLASLKAHLMLHEKEENLMCPECGDEFSLQVCFHQLTDKERISLIYLKLSLVRFVVAIFKSEQPKVEILPFSQTEPFR